MAGADGVVAGGFEQLDFALFGTAVGGGEGKRADAEGGGETVYYFIVLIQ